MSRRSRAPNPLISDDPRPVDIGSEGEAVPPESPEPESDKDSSFDEAADRKGKAAERLNRTPKTRVRHGSSVPTVRKDRAREIDPNKGCCLLTLEEQPAPAIQAAHIMACATSQRELTALEWAWGMEYRTLHVDTSKNILFLRSDLRITFDHNFWLLIPDFTLLEEIHNQVLARSADLKNAERPPITDLYDRAMEFEYSMIPYEKMSDVTISRRVGLPKPPKDPFLKLPSRGRNDYSYPYYRFPNLKSHVHPHFVIFNAGQKLDVAQSPHIAPAVANQILEIYHLWILAPPAHFTAVERPAPTGPLSDNGEGDGGDGGGPQQRWTRAKSRLSKSSTNDQQSQPEGGTSYGHKRDGMPPAMDVDDEDESDDDSEIDDDDDEVMDYATWKATLTQWKKHASDAATSEGGWESEVLNDAQIGAYVDEQPRSPRKEPWDTWRAPWMDTRLTDEPLDTRTFASNDWAVLEYQTYLNRDSSR